VESDHQRQGGNHDASQARMVVLVYLTPTSLLVGQSIDVVMKPPAKLNFNSAQVSIDATDQNTRSDALSKDFETKLGTELEALLLVARFKD